MDLQELFDIFEFPDHAACGTGTPLLRKAIHVIWGGKCAYTGQSISFDEMQIDHIIPSALGGPDNYYNYVPSHPTINNTKRMMFDVDAVLPLLSLVKIVYVPKLEKEMERLRISKSKRNDVLDVFFTRPMQVILGKFFEGGADVEFNVNTLCTEHTSSASIQKVINGLVSCGLLLERRLGNQRRLRINKDFAFYTQLKDMFLANRAT